MHSFVWSVFAFYIVVALSLSGTARAQFIARIAASDGAPGDYFGGYTQFGGEGAAAIFGDTAVVGATGGVSETITGNGAVYVFQRDEGGQNNWGQAAKLTLPDSTRAGFGLNVAIQENLIVGTAPSEVVGPIGGLCVGTGAAHVFVHEDVEGDTWTHVQRLAASDGRGHCVGSGGTFIDGTTIAVGASWNNGATGTAYIFEATQDDEELWDESAVVSAADGSGSTFFGADMGISANTLIVSRPLSSEQGFQSGSAYVFERSETDPSQWLQVKTLTASDAGGGDWFGIAVDTFKDTAIIGAHRGRLTTEPSIRSGAAYILERNEGGPNNWGEVAKLVPSDGQNGDGFGESVAVYGDLAIVGARKDAEGDGSALGPGAAYVFARNAGGPDKWGQILKLSAPDETNNNHFGIAVDIFEDIAIVAAAGVDANTGAAYIFQVPEPSSALLFLAGLFPLLKVRRRTAGDRSHETYA